MKRNLSVVNMINSYAVAVVSVKGISDSGE